MKNLFIALKNENIMSEESFQYLKYKSFKKGECLLRQGEELKALYILMKGTVRTMHITANGNSMLFSLARSISTLGEMEFMNEKIVNNEVYAVEDCECLMLDMKNRDKLLKDRIFLHYVALTIADRYYNSGHNLAFSLNFPVKNRLAAYLIGCENNNIINENFVEVAKIIGCSYRQLQRILKEFEEESLILKIKRSMYEIIDYDKLDDLGEDSYYL